MNLDNFVIDVELSFSKTELAILKAVSQKMNLDLPSTVRKCLFDKCNEILGSDNTN